MTPAEIMAALEGNGSLPREALEAAGQSRDAMVPVFVDYIGKLQSAGIDDLEGMDAFVFIFFLLAEWRETRAYRPLATLLRRDPEFLDVLLGDSITEASARVMAGVFDGDLQPLFDILLDDDADGFLRGEMFDTLAIVALENPDLRPGITQFLIDFFDLTGTVTGEEVWWAWAECIAALGLANMDTAVRAVFDSGLITPDHSRIEDFTERLKATVDTGRPDWFTGISSNTLITDTIAELEPWYCFTPEYLAKKAAGRLNVMSSLMPRSGDPFNGVFTGKIGRNDPCPCGSGKKFKKCCLQ
ncbi:Protein of unknown function DUF1186 [Paracoccaceae bacterium]